MLKRREGGSEDKEQKEANMVVLINRFYSRAALGWQHVRKRLCLYKGKAPHLRLVSILYAVV
jgi:hypothetical protein